MNKKGFTLVEVMAVIIVLSVLALIVVPIVSNQVFQARIDSLKSLEKIYERNTKTYIMNNPEYWPNNDGQSIQIPLDTIREEYGLAPIKNPQDGELCDGFVHVTRISFEEFDYKTYIVCGDYYETDVTFDIPSLPENDDIAYINDPDNIGENATPCLIEGNEFTHILDKRGDTTYAVTQIGEQCWMAENLAYTTPECLGATWNSSSPLNACDTHSTSWGDEVLYQWGAAMDGSTIEGSQGLCPTGWTIPTDNEWKELEMYLGMTQAEADETGWRGTNEGDQLKDDVNWNGTNTIGFSGLRAGHRGASGDLDLVGSYGFWWSSSPSGTNAWGRGLNSGVSTVARSIYSSTFGRSVRCILDN